MKSFRSSEDKVQRVKYKLQTSEIKVQTSKIKVQTSGIKLPVICGVELENLSLDYVDHAAVLNTDFSFDLPRFVKKFKEYLYWKQVNKKDKRHTMLSYI